VFKFHYFFFFLSCLALYKASLRVHENSPNLYPTIHRVILRVWNFEPAYILTLDPINIEGIVEWRSYITLSFGLKTSLPCIKNNLRHVLGAVWFSLNVFLFCMYKFDI